MLNEDEIVKYIRERVDSEYIENTHLKEKEIYFNSDNYNAVCLVKIKRILKNKNNSYKKKEALGQICNPRENYVPLYREIRLFTRDSNVTETILIKFTSGNIRESDYYIIPVKIELKENGNTFQPVHETEIIKALGSVNDLYIMRSRKDEINDLEKRIQNLKEELERHEEQRDKYTKQCNELDSELKAKQSQRSKIESELAAMEKLGFKKDGTLSSAINSSSFKYSYNAVANKLFENEENKDIIASYKLKGPQIIERFLSAICTNQIIILSGPSGTGKTTLPNIVAECIDGAKCTTISVQPSWTDSQDLLGFYNPVENRYVSTEFLDALLDAIKDPEHLHFIILDEMNLAHVEYYFAKYLSAMELSEKKIQLYSNRLLENKRADLIKKFQNIIDDEEDAEKYIERLKTAISNKAEDEIEEILNELPNGSSLQKWAEECKSFFYEQDIFPAAIVIPDNIQIVGTINMDETTKNISPKVLDRSYVIEIRDTDEAYSESKSVINENDADTIQDDILEILKDKLDKIVDYNKNEKIIMRASERLKIQLENMINSMSERRINEDAFLDYFVLSKVLPTIVCNDISEDELNDDKIKDIISEKYPESIKKLKDSYNKDYKSFDYWR